ncbi:glyoxylate/hydroxypyruvate reductase A [Jiella sp. MQZ9-1]|uniref:Glyoxylate/hydroxypyruvate reductase A n=1 Tax=Jiella flava TaxID=2816857 RepID=A0A939FYR7_9HYPH|nr:glyoxylate/hydroxypyruvate reductase A [Jiella flava]MBO0663196.1 glyoxylate/hydroxypyruvate reductase A [Jiella flava]MCD2471771.1 glyoxylate/hydroxypyruvate reductase A [Jiella flava]
MTILLSVTGFDPSRWWEALHLAAPDRRIVVDPAAATGEPIDYAVVWKQPPGLLATLPNLKAIFSLGAGVDHILADRELPDVPVVRIVADDLKDRMSEYVVWRVLDHFRRGRAYRQQQAQKIWHERMQPAAKDVTVGIMGLGVLGIDAATKLGVLGFKLTGWSRSAKRVEGVETFAGTAGLAPFLGASDIVVVLLPLTSETRGIIGADLLSKLKRETPLGGPVLINAGRGALQDEVAILAALDDERLMEASLDVFTVEPLPAESRLWSHPKVFVTPHAAALSDPDSLAPIIMRQIAAHERGEPLENVADRTAGY